MINKNEAYRCLCDIHHNGHTLNEGDVIVATGATTFVDSTNHTWNISEDEQDMIEPIKSPFCSIVNDNGKIGSLQTQVGGDHYKKLAIQPVEYITKNKLTFNEGNIVKYATRNRFKDGAKDIRKVIQYAKIILQMEYGYTDEQINEL